MNTIHSLVAAVVMLVLGALLTGTSKAALTMSDLNNEEYNTLVSSSIFSWKIELFAGFSSESTPEIVVNVNGIRSFSHIWSYPEQIVVAQNALGELEIRVGSLVIFKDSSNVQPFTPVVPYNSLILTVGDAAFFGPTRVVNSTINGLGLRDLVAEDNNTLVTQYDRLKIGGINGEFTLNATFDLNPSAFDRESLFSIEAIHVPEPSAFALCALAGTAMILRRGRPTGTHR